MFEILGFLGAILMGISLGLIGGGGSILSVPIFVYFFAITPTLATAYSLFVVGLAALVGGIQNIKKKQVDFKSGIIFAIPSFVGVYSVRKFVIPQLPDVLFSIGSFMVTRDILIMLVFSIVMLVASISMIRSKGREDIEKKELSPPLRTLIIAAEGLLVGGVTGFVGAGGGFLIIPALVLLVGLEMKIAVGTSLLIIAFKSLLGFLGDVSTQPIIDWVFLMQFSCVSLLGIFIGTYLSTKIDGKNLKVGFGWFVLVMGIFILGKQVL
ncbi:MAG: sulfite exporter TauE/SafE family protein [Bdellovibrionales bacterium]|nr:sulfite exporter TauE/SafE family protein [Bdellovibrionales bacterium]